MNDRFTPTALGLALIDAFCSSGGVVLIKSGLASATISWPTLITGLVIYGISVVLGMLLMSRYALSLVYPIVVGLSLPALALISVLFLDESITPFKVAGSAVIILGVTLMVGNTHNESTQQ